MWEKIDRILSDVKDYHVPVAIVIFAATSGYHFFTHLDLGTQYTNIIYATYGFLGGHAYLNGKFGNGNANPGQPPQQ